MGRKRRSAALREPSSGRKGGRNRGSNSTSSTQDHAPDATTEVDAFMAERDLIPLHNQLGADVSESESSSGDDPDAGLQLDEGSSSSSSSSDDSSSDEDGDEEMSNALGDATEAELLMLREKEVAYNEQREQYLQREEELLEQWGDKTSEYYGADEQDSDNEMAAEEEEEEAKRMQRERAAQLAGSDEESSDDEDMLSTLAAKVRARKAAKAKGKGGAAAANGSALAESELLSSIGGTGLDPASLGFGSSSSAASSSTKDLGSLGTAEKLRILQIQSPDLLGVLNEFKTQVKAVREYVKPLLERARASQVKTSDGISFLEVQYHLLLNYCTNLTFFMLLKSRGLSVKGHPVVKHLARVRTYLERIRPIEQKLKYQIDKLMQLATSAGNVGAGKADPTSFQPRLQDFAAGDSDGEDAGSGAAAAAAAASSEVYRPPRFSATEFVDKAEQKRRRREAAMRQRASSSSLMREMAEELSSKPTEVAAHGGAVRELDEDELERRKYEEDNFMRLAETREDKKRRKAREQISAFDDLDDFGDLSALIKTADKILPSEGGTRYAEAEFDDDGDVDMGGRFGDDEDELEEGYDLYQQFAAQTRDKKRAREERALARQPVLDEQDPDTFLPSHGRRKATKAILKNRGLTRYRPKDRKTARTKNRWKFEKMLKKRKSAVREFAGKEINYGGDKSGIKTHLVRSTSLNQ